MDASAPVWLGLGWWSLSTAVHWTSAALARKPRRAPTLRHRPADFSIVAPMNGAGDASAAYVRALADLAGSGAEILICVASADDGAVAPIRALWPDAPILIGNDDTFNPKMNN